MAGETNVIEWSYGPAESTRLRALLYVSVGIVGGAVVLLGIGTLALLAAFVGDVTRFGLATSAVVLIFTVLIAVRAATFLVAFRDVRQQSPQSRGLTAYFERRWLVVASVLGTAALALSVFVEPGFVSVPFAVAVSSFLVVAVLSTAGEIDPETRTLRTGDDELLLLDGLSAVRQVHIGGFALCWFSFADGTVSRPAVLPAATVRAARPVFEAAIAHPVETSSPDHLARVVLAGLALASLAFAGFLLFMVAGESAKAGMVVPAAYVAGVLAVIFLGAALFTT